jgi:hypothetical protein
MGLQVLCEAKASPRQNGFHLNAVGETVGFLKGDYFNISSLILLNSFFLNSLNFFTFRKEIREGKLLLSKCEPLSTNTSTTTTTKLNLKKNKGNMKYFKHINTKPG